MKAQSADFAFCFAESYFCNLPANSFFVYERGKFRKKTSSPFYSARSFAKMAQEDGVGAFWRNIVTEEFYFFFIFTVFFI